MDLMRGQICLKVAVYKQSQWLDSFKIFVESARHTPQAKQQTFQQQTKNYYTSRAVINTSNTHKKKQGKKAFKLKLD